jgi:hypothetical protein
MAWSLTVPHGKTLRQVEVEKNRVDGQMATVRAARDALGVTARGIDSSTPHAKPRRRKSVATRVTLSQRMKVYWAKRKAGLTLNKTNNARTSTWFLVSRIRTCYERPWKRPEAPTVRWAQRVQGPQESSISHYA